jgi:hypothetical protein
MSAPKVKPITAKERKLWEQHNVETLREWAALPFAEKIKMVEELEKLARSIHGEKFLSSTDEHLEPWGTLAP